MISIDPDASIREYLELQLPVRAMGDLLYRSRIFSYLAAATPGLKEMVTIGKIWELALKERKTRGAEPYDLVIVDAPATGHGIGLLQTPRTFAEIARRRPDGEPGLDDRQDAAQPQAVGRRDRRATRGDAGERVGDARGGAVRRVEIAVDAIYMNGLFPRALHGSRGAGCSRRRGPEPASGVSSAIGAALDEARRARAHREQLARLRELTQTDIAELPFVFSPELGSAGLERLAAELAR